MVHVDKVNFKGDPNIGLYCVATDKYAILGEELNKNKLKLLNEVLDVPVITSNIYGTPFVGIFCVANSNTVLVPEIIFDKEFENLKKQLSGIADVKKIKTLKTALGNNILCNDKIGILSQEFSEKESKDIQNALDVKTKTMKLAEGDVPGSYGILTNKGGIFGSIVQNAEIKVAEKLTGFEIGVGTVSTGSSIMSSGIIANSNGFLVSSNSTGFEMGRIDESLGFI